MRAPLVACALVALTVAAYAPLWDNGFVNYDDGLEITNNPQVNSGLSAGNAAWAFTSFHDANWVPLARLSLMLDAEVFGLEPRAFHATSLLFHLAAVLLLFAALESATGAFWCSAFAAAVFAVHPLHVESVAWASLRKDVVSGAAWALTLLVYARYARARDAESRQRARRLYLALLASFTLGLLAKQILVTLPFVLLLLDEWPLGRLRDGAGRLDGVRLRRAILEKLPLLGLAVAAVAITVIAQQRWGTVHSLDAIPFRLRLANALVSVAVYLRRCFWPVDLAVFYPHPLESLALGPVIASAALILALSAGALWQLRRRPYLAVGWLLFLGMLFPLLGWVQIGEASMADRYMYLPLLGVTLAVTWGVAECAARWPRLVGPIAAAAIAVALALAATSAAQVRTWRASIPLFERALAVTERNALAHINLGEALTRAGRLDEASRQFAAALAITPASPMVSGLQGELLLEQGHWREAEARFREALAGRREPARWHAGLAWALYQQGELESAVRHYRVSLELRPDVAHRHGNLGRVLVASGDGPAAEQSFLSGLRIDPRLDVRGQLAVLLGSRGDTPAALGVLDEGIALEPGRADLHALRARVLEESGRRPEALAGYRRALELAERAGQAALAARIHAQLEAGGPP